MSETATTPPSGDPHWAIIYLREDIQDLRQEIRQVYNRIDAVNSRIDARFTVLMATMIGLSGILAGLIKL